MWQSLLLDYINSIYKSVDLEDLVFEGPRQSVHKKWFHSKEQSISLMRLIGIWLQKSCGLCGSLINFTMVNYRKNSFYMGKDARLFL